MHKRDILLKDPAFALSSEAELNLERQRQPRSQGLYSSRFWWEEERPWERGCDSVSKKADLVKF